MDTPGLAAMHKARSVSRSLHRVSAALMICLVPSAASAEASANEVIARLDSGDRPTFIPYISGLVGGLSWANAELKSKNLPPLFCVPDKLATTPDQDEQIFRDYVRQHPKEGFFPAGMVVMDAFEATFPCPR